MSCKNVSNGELLSESKRYLGEHGDIFVRNNESLTIINKIDKNLHITWMN